MQAADLSLDLTRHWHSSVTPILRQQSKASASALCIVTVVPEMSTWKLSKFLTVLGNATHPVPPTVGLFAINALKDFGNTLDTIGYGLY